MPCLKGGLHGLKADPSARADDQDCRHRVLLPAWLTSCATQAIAPQGGTGGLKHMKCWRVPAMRRGEAVGGFGGLGGIMGQLFPVIAAWRRRVAPGTRTSSTRSDTPNWRPTGSRTFGGTKPERPIHDPFVGLAGAGKLGTTSASPSITCAVSPARAANIALIAAMASSICSSLICLIMLECSICISRGTKSAQIFM